MVGSPSTQSALVNNSQAMEPGPGERERAGVVFLLPRSSHARCVKRIQWLTRDGVEPRVFAFERNYLDVNIKMNQMPYTSLGLIEHRRYGRRLFVLFRSVPTVAGSVKKCDAIYCFGLDLLVLGWFSRACTRSRALLVYEVADVLEVQCGKSLLSRLVRSVERFLLRRTAALVVTSPAYVEGYYCRFRHLPPVFLIENKFGHEVDPEAIEEVRAMPVCRDPGVVTIGLLGALRCMRSLDLLFETAARADGRIRIHIRGLVMSEAIRQRLHEAPPHVVIEGPFKPEVDMPAMYSEIDVGWVADYHATTNTKMARRNRFYDCCMFARPMIAQKGSADAVIVEREGLGLIIDAEDREQAIGAMLALTPAQIETWRKNVLALPRGVFAHEPGDEHADLARFIANPDPMLATLGPDSHGATGVTAETPHSQRRGDGK